MTIDILVTQKGNLGVLTLNRPQTLNALTFAMIQLLSQQLKAWEIDNTIHAVVIQAAEGKAFCAGGDVRWLYEMGKQKDPIQQQFFIEEYRLNRLIHQYKKPYIALMNGLTMGGGVGVSLHGSHRVASESFVFAMPETTIGFFPDIGASYLLSRCAGMMGIYLGLTGIRLNTEESLHQGLITHNIPFSAFPQVLESLSQLDLSTDPFLQVSRCLTQYSHPDKQAFPAQAAVDHCFSHATIEEIIASLRQVNNDWHQETATALLSKSPLSLKVTLEQLRRAKSLEFDDCIAMDAALVRHFMHNHDFYEGVRALLIDKDKSPRWQPSTLNEVSAELVNRYFEGFISSL